MTRPIAMTTLSPPTIKLPSFSRLSPRAHYNQTIPFFSLPVKTQPLCHPKPTHNRIGFLYTTRKLGFCLNAENGEGKSKKSDDAAENWARGESTMPDRFRHLTSQVPDPPVRWPYFVALGFLVYAWRAVLFELGNWRRVVLAIISFVGYLLKLLLALIFHFIGDPITFLIRCVETAIYTVRAFYSSIVAYAPVPELTMMIMLASAILAVGDAAVPNSVSSQPYLLTISGLIGYAAVRSYISEPLFWTFLVGLYGFSRLIRKRDDVTSALPSAAVLVAVGEPWIRFLVTVSYLALAVSHHSKNLSKEEEIEVPTGHNSVPFPLLFAALAIGIHLAAKWAGYRHLTWMIV